MAKAHTPFAIAYDFDGTLAPGNMQEYDFVPALGIKPKAFWEEVKVLAEEHESDEILSYMHLMIKKASAKDIQIKRDSFVQFGNSIQFFPGVLEWFKRINAYGKTKQVRVEHYIISSGLREMIEGTPIKGAFKKVYASGFMYDQNGVATWPALAVNYTTKTQYLFRINKGSLDVHDNSVINKFVAQDKRRIPFQNMVFIGDGETDIPSMRLVKDLGGHAIAVYPSKKRGALDKAKKLVTEGRANLVTVADYSEDSPIDSAVKGMIDLAAARRQINEAGR